MSNRLTWGGTLLSQSQSGVVVMQCVGGLKMCLHIVLEDMTSPIAGHAKKSY
jgi:hypothetical protein